MDKEKLGKFIAVTRKEQGMTQRQLAERLHITDKAVSKWERGVCYPDVTLMEQLAETLGLTITELMTCQKQEPEREEQDMAMKALLDISDQSVRREKKRGLVNMALLVAALLLIAALVTYFVTQVSEVRRTSIVSKESDGTNHYLYVADRNHLIQLSCDESTYELVTVDGDEKIFYTISCSWNQLTHKGEVLSCEPGGLVLGTPMNMTGSAAGVDSLLGIDCVVEEYTKIYPDPYADGGKIRYIYDLRYFYCGDGASYYFEDPDRMEQEHLLLTVTDSYATMKIDDDEDGVVELFVLTRYKEKPFMRYDLVEGEIVGSYVDEVPDEVLVGLKSVN